MRIRKNAKVSPLCFSSHTSPLCKLNQSPWDVIPVHLPPPPPNSCFSYQAVMQAAEGDAGVTATGSFGHGDSVGAVESVASMRISVNGGAGEKSMLLSSETVSAASEEETIVDGDDKEEEDGIDEFKEGGEAIVGRAGVRCCKGDGKGWRCRKEAKDGHARCDHHLAQLRSYSGSYSYDDCPSFLGRNSSEATGFLRPYNHPARAKKPPLPSSARRYRHSAQVRTYTYNDYLSSLERNSGESTGFFRAPHHHHRAQAKKPLPPAAASSNPYEFYYYSGFGPLWRKRRSGLGRGESSNASQPNPSSTTDEITGGGGGGGVGGRDNELDFDYSDDDGDENVGRKRRKPVKARSLKSLM